MVTSVRMIAVSLLVGCAANSAPPVAEVGTGVDAWEPFPGDIAYLVEGAQGGRHIIGNVRMDGLAPGSDMSDAPATRFDIFTDDGTRVSEDIPPFHQPFDVTPDGLYTLPYGRIVFVKSAAAEILDTVVEFRVQVTDRDDRSAGDARWVLVQPYVP